MWRNATDANNKLLNAVASGDKGAFTKLFYMFHQELGEFILKLTKSKPIAEEVVQEVFIKVWTHREALSGVKSFRAYLFTVARNHAFNVLRDETRKTFLIEDLFTVARNHAFNVLRDETRKTFLIEDFERYPLVDTDDTAVEKEALYAIVEKAVALLPPQQQKVWKLNKEEGLPYQKIAEQLKLSPLTVKRHISLAMASIIRYVRAKGSHLTFWIFLLQYTTI